MAYTYRNPHRQELLRIDQQIQEMRERINFCTSELKKLEENRKALLPFAEAEADEEMTASLPILCLRVLSFTPNHGVSVPKIREGLRVIGVEVTGRNPLAILHTTLGRLVKSGYATPAAGSPGNTTHYQILPAGMQLLQRER